MKSGLKQYPLNTIILFLLACGLLVRYVLYLYTRFIVEDAYITFRFAEQIAAGNGFVHNTGERIYGTTTPFFTLLLAAWRIITNNDLATGAFILNLAASIAVLIFVWMALRELGSTPAQQVYAIALLALSRQTVFAEVKGLETVWVALFMAASWWALATGRITLAGLFCGLLLWTRPDTFLWILALALGTVSRSSVRQAAQILLVAGLVYLPWVIFAAWYFGSPIPHTIIAKWVAYIQFNTSPIYEQIPIVLNSFAPSSVSFNFLEINALTWTIISICIWQSLHTIKSKWMNILSIFAILEISRLVITKATFFVHYLYPAQWTILLIFGLGLGSLHDAMFLKRGVVYRVLFGLAITLLATINAIAMINSARIRQEYQAVRQESTLKGIGLWLNQNTPPDSVVLLEPLGYIGYYADRKIIDEVGLISPGIVEMKRNRIDDVYQYATVYHVDYIVAHCHEAQTWLQRSADGEISFTEDFFLAAKFNPLGFEINNMEGPNGLARDACFEIWQRGK
jgi:hypothetical protein